MTCQECSNSFVRENHSVHVLQAVSFGIWASPKNRVKGRSQQFSLPGRGRFPPRAVPTVLLGQFDIFVSPHVVTAPCHRFFPVSAAFCIARAAHHLPSSNTHTSHCQSLQAWLVVFLQLPSHNDTSTFHVVGPALVWSPAQAQDSTKLPQFPNAQCLEH